MADVTLATHLLYSDDFTSYTSDADVVAAYPSLVPGENTYDEDSAEWGLTYGPDGQPGLRDKTSPARDTGSIAKQGLNPNGREFRVKGRWDFSAPNDILGAHAIINIGWTTSDPDDLWKASLVQVNWRDDAGGSLSMVVKTSPPYGNALSGTRWGVDLDGIAPPNVPKTVEMKARRSEMTETSPGVFEPSTDGRAELWIDGVMVAEFDGPVWWRETDFNEDPYWNEVAATFVGEFSLWEVWDEPNPNPDIGEGGNPAFECCCEEPAGPSVGDSVEDVDPVGTLPPWERSCTGGGLVDGVSDLTDGEAWS